MTELERIENNINGEQAPEIYTVLRVKNINNPEEELNTFKETISVIIRNKHLDWKDPKWYELFPEKVVKFTKQLKKIDYHKDDLISHIPSMVDKVKDVRKWEWYSSKLNDGGFEVFFIGNFRGIFIPIVHHQGIPHANIFTEEDGVEYPTRALTDVLTYRKWNPDTYELK